MQNATRDGRRAMLMLNDDEIDIICNARRGEASDAKMSGKRHVQKSKNRPARQKHTRNARI